MLTGGSPAPQNAATSPAFGQNASGLWNKPTTTQAPTSFGQISAPSQFGQTNTQSSLFTKPAGTSMFGATNQPATSAFGQAQPAQGGSLFGVQTQTQAPLFGVQTQPQ